MEYINNNITFNNVKTSGLQLSSTPLLVNGLIGTDPDDGSGIINAVDIDWNCANLEPLISNEKIKNKLSKLTINTTGDLLKLITELINLINTQENWFSIGTKEITNNNYKVVNNAHEVNQYPTELSYTIEGDRAYLYCLISIDKTIEVIEPNFNVPIDLIELTNIYIPNHKVIRSATKCSGTLPIKIYDYEEEEEKYWFSIGTKKITSYNYKVVNNATQVDQYPEELSYTIDDERSYLYCLVSENKNVEIIEPTFGIPIDTITIADFNVPGYKVIRSATKCIRTLPIKIY